MKLEFIAQKRTAQLQHALNYQCLDEYIPQKADNERQMWQTATRGLAQILKVNHCYIELYDSQKTTATVVHEYTKTSYLEQGIVKKTAEFPELYDRLFDKELLQFSDRIALFGIQKQPMTRLACPIYDKQDLFGNLWLIRPKEQMFWEWEIELIKQVATQCANALYQTQCDRPVWQQLRKLETLNQQKNDFFKAIFHELLGQTTSIQIAAQTLENLLQDEIADPKNKILPKVINLFHQSCQQQTQLAHDLLTFCHLDGHQKENLLQKIDLSIWLPRIIKPFYQKFYLRQQKLIVDLAKNLPQLTIDSFTLERIVVELINNACKYTPQNETISISVRQVNGMIQLSVCNTGVEIPISEQKLIFEEFYRFPDNDFWEMGGTGLGLNLVQKLTRVLGGSIELKSGNLQTTFTLFIPIKFKLD